LRPQYLLLKFTQYVLYIHNIYIIIYTYVCMCVYSLVPLWRMWKEKWHEEWGFRSSHFAVGWNRSNGRTWSHWTPSSTSTWVSGGRWGLSWMIRWSDDGPRSDHFLVHF
jgi:hypothetical protein